MSSLCPDPDQRKLRVGLYKCPDCGAEVQIFSDETCVRCHECGKMVNRNKVSPCIDWCASARQCLGEEGWKVLNSRFKKERG